MKVKKQDKLVKQLEYSGIKIEQLTYKNLTLRSNLTKCLWDALIIFFFVFGLVGFFTTAFSLPCNMFKLTVFSAFISLYFAMFYLRKYCFNIGYIITLFSIVYYSIRHYEEVNSGYSAILNLIIIKIDEELNLASLREFTEEITDRYVTITACMVVIITMLACLFNMWVSRRNSILCPLLLVLLVMEFCIYLNDEFSYLYLLVILIAFTLFIFTKQNDELPVDIKKRQRTYISKKKRILFKGRRVETKGNLYSAVVFTLATLFVSLIVFTFVPKTYVEANSELKNKTDKIVSEVAMKGFSALFGSTSNGTGGMNNGTFGDVRSVSYDYETDLEVTLVPYTWRPVYIPTFSANTYDLVNRRWYQNISYYQGDSDNNYYYYNDFKAEYLTPYTILNQLDSDSLDEVRSATAKFMITNVAAGDTYPAALYYDGRTSNAPAVNIGRGDSIIFDYTPLLYDYSNLPTVDDSYFFISDSSMQEYVEENYLAVPIRLQNDLKRICFQEGFGGTTEEVVNQIIEFLRADYKYTLSPGATPEGEDFVLYFLEKKKQGFCVHFASSACLLLRQMGIPAKYVEGYSFDYSVYEDATLFKPDSFESENLYTFSAKEELSKKDIDVFDDMDWYTGYNQMNFNEPVTIDLTDANAHAWVEVYFEGFGWVPVEFTVGSMAEDGNINDFSSMLNNISSGSSGNGILNNTGINQAAQTVGRVINYGLRNLVKIVIILILLIILVRKLQFSYMIYFARDKKRAVYQYRFLTDLIKKDLSKKRKKDNQLQYEDIIISHSVLKLLLKKEYGMARTSAERAVYSFEAYNYSEYGCGVDIDGVTESFKKISDRILEHMGFFCRMLYRLYLYMPNKSLKNKKNHLKSENIEFNEYFLKDYQSDSIDYITGADYNESSTKSENISKDDIGNEDVSNEDLDDVAGKKTKHSNTSIKWLIIAIVFIILLALVLHFTQKDDLSSALRDDDVVNTDDTGNENISADGRTYSQVYARNYCNDSSVVFHSDLIKEYAKNSCLIVDATYLGSYEGQNMYSFKLNDIVHNNTNGSISNTFTLYVYDSMSEVFPKLRIGDRIIISVHLHQSSTAGVDDYYIWDDVSLFYVINNETLFSAYKEYDKYDGYKVDRFKELIRNN